MEDMIICCGYYGYLDWLQNWPPPCNWNIAGSGIKQIIIRYLFFNVPDFIDSLHLK